MDYREYLTPEQLAAIYAQEQQANASAASAGELALSLLSGAAAEPLSGLAGILSMVAGGNAQQNADWVRKVQDGMTYQPRDPAALQNFVELMQPVAEAIEGGSRYLGDKTLEYTGSPALAAAAYTLPMGAAEVIDSTPLLYAARKMPKRGLLNASIDVNDIGGQSRLGGKQRGVWGAGGAEGAPHDQMLRAQQMLDEGMTPAQVWDETLKTGTPIYVDAQGNLTYPIPATNLKTKPPWQKSIFDPRERAQQLAKERFGVDDVRDLKAVDQNPIWDQAFREQDELLKSYAPSEVHALTPNSMQTVGEYFDYPELYEAYPRARDIELRGTGPDNSYRGVFYEDQGFNGVGRIDLQTHTKDAQGNLVPVPLDTIESVLEHELTHAVQGWEDLPRGANKSIGGHIAKQSDKAQEMAYGLIDQLDVQAQDIMKSTDVSNTSAALHTSRVMDTINQLERYLKDYYNGGKLTDKRRHILNAGWVMDHNKEYRMRMDINWPKRHRPQAERDAAYATYIENVIKDARENLDPDLVKMVESTGVKNPTRKLERQVDKVNQQLRPIQDRQYEISKLARTGAEPSRIPAGTIYEDDGNWYAKGLLDDNYRAKRFSSESSAKRGYLEAVNASNNYFNVEGEFNARLAQEYQKKAKTLGDDAYKLNPYFTEQWRDYPQSHRLVIDEYGNLDPNIHQWVNFNDYVFRDNLLDIDSPSPIKWKKR